VSTAVDTVYADFNNCDVQKRVRLNTAGTEMDLEKLSIRLQEGMTLRICDDDLAGEGVVVFSEEEKIWVIEVKWQLVRDL